MAADLKNQFLRNIFIPASLVTSLAAPLAAEANTVDIQDDAQQSVHHYLDFNILSIHDPFKRDMTTYWEEGKEKPFNEKNWGLGYTQLRDVTEAFGGIFRLGGTAGYYKNSYEKDSFYLGGVVEQAYRLGSKWEVAVGAMAGGITGYKHLLGYDVTPAGQFFVRGEYDNTVSVKLGFIPEFGIDDKKNPALVTLQASYKF
ncbi:MAG: hypothetical protein CL561_03940 [Alphaproteobacteria bacterium]|nr:hypothetical protein [Alphaproteobacteria bacterium]|tara:strand:+ start:5487 stop:6086 length:600 start_codon:yes stop_codon:yes gene_type:complete